MIRHKCFLSFHNSLLQIPRANVYNLPSFFVSVLYLGEANLLCGIGSCSRQMGLPIHSDDAIQQLESPSIDLYDQCLPVVRPNYFWCTSVLVAFDTEIVDLIMEGACLPCFLLFPVLFSFWGLELLAENFWWILVVFWDYFSSNMDVI